ncbi:MAG: HAMP domain-containing sensor histidine kinase [Pseudomonadota bacterium]
MGHGNDDYELRQANQRLSALVELAGLLADPGLEAGVKLQRCLEGLAGLIGAESASLMLAEGESLIVQAATNPRLVGLALPLDQDAISTQVLGDCQPVYLRDLGQSPLAGLGRQGDRSFYRTPSLLSLPLMVDGQAVGVLNLGDKAGAAAFDPADLELAQELARHLSRQIHFSVLHARLDQAHQELVAAQQAKDDLLQLIFHDMKAPLTAVKELLRLLGPERETAEAERGQYLALAEAELEVLWRRVTNLLDLNRMDAGQWPLQTAPLDLASLAAEVVERMAVLARPRGVELELTIQARPRPPADEDLVERILVNLLLNAIRHSDPDQDGGGGVRVHLSAGQGSALLEVADSGPGVDPELGPAVFERHAQGRVNRGAAGLGLYFCRRAARLLGGEVYYVNSPQGGARFSLVLPLAEA